MHFKKVECLVRTYQIAVWGIYYQNGQYIYIYIYKDNLFHLLLIIIIFKIIIIIHHKY